MTAKPKAIKWLGVDCVTLANNHFYDYGDQGVRNTLQACELSGIDYVGGGNNISEAGTILYKTIREETLAIINCCEHEFNIASEEHGGANPLDPVRQYYAIKEARKKADYVMVIVHGGHEHYQLPSQRMVSLYRFFIDAGADAVVNHHQHCFSSFERHNDKPVFYGIGNFCFDIKPVKTGENWNYGYMVVLDFNKGEILSEIIPYEQCAEKAEVLLLPQNAFDKRIKELCDITADSEALIKHNNRYYEKSMDLISIILNSNKNRYRRVLSRLLNTNKRIRDDYLVSLYNLVLCEAHRDKLSYFLETLYKRINEK